MAALAILELSEDEIDIVPCALSADVFAALLSGRVEAAILPIENSLHGSVAEHYDLLLEHPVRIDREYQLRIRHNLIAAAGVALADIRHILSHPVALSQCRRFLAGFTQAHALPFYDTAGSVKHVVAHALADTAGVAPALAAEEYGADVLVEGIEDNPENFTRFHLLRRADAAVEADVEADKISLALSLDHRPGTLAAALQVLAQTGVDLTKIESRPVHGSPWEYVFYLDFRFTNAQGVQAALAALQPHCRMLKELGRYKAA